MTVDELSVIITANSEQFKKELDKVSQSLNDVQKDSNKSTNGILNSFSMLKKGIVALAIGKVIKDSISTAMETIESDNLFKHVLGNLSKDTYNWSNKVSKALGLSAVAIRKNTGTIYSMTTSMGIAENTALSMSKGVSLLAQDMAAFYNIDPSVAFSKLQSGLTGMSVPLKELGILIEDDIIKETAYKEGIAKDGEELTAQQKVFSRYIAILKQTKNAQGALAREMNTPTNLLRRLKTEISNCANTIGTILMPIVSKALVLINAFVKVLSNALSSLASFLGFGKSSLEDSTEVASNNISSLASSMEDADESAKSIKKSIAGFDEIENLNVDNSSTNIIETEFNGFKLADYNAGLDSIEDKTKQVVDKIQKIFDGFKIKAINFTPIIDSLNRLLEAIKPFGKDIWNGLKWGIENVISPLANFTIENAIPTFLDEISNALTIFNEKQNESVSFLIGNISDCATDIFKIVSEIIRGINNKLSKLWKDIKTDLERLLKNCFKLVKAIFIDTKDEIKKRGKEIKNSIKGILSDIWDTLLAPVAIKVTKILADIATSLTDFWDNYGKSIFDKIGEAIDKTIESFQKFWDDVVEPILEPFFKVVTDFWYNHGKPMLDKSLNLIGKLIEGILELYNKAFLPLINWLVDKAKPIILQIAEVFFEYWANKISIIVDVVGDLADALSGLIDFVVGVFTGNWDKAWDGIIDTVKAVKNAVTDIVKGMINFIIIGVNKLIDGINKMSFEVPDWVPSIGGKKLGFNISKIPKLARGGIVNSPTVAMIGERGKEAVVPLENNTEWIDKLANRLLTMILAMKANEDNRPINVTVTSKLNGKVVSKELIRDLNSEAKRLGYREILST